MEEFDNWEEISMPCQIRNYSNNFRLLTSMLGVSCVCMNSCLGGIAENALLAIIS